MSEEPKKAQPQIILYRGWPDQGKHVWSPFVIKLEARLRFAGLSYKTEAGSTIKAPKGKIPYIEYQESKDNQSAQLADSTLIIKHLIQSNILPDLNVNVSPIARAHDLAIRALLEEKLYFYHTRERWEGNYYPMRDHILSALSYPMRVFVGLMIYRKTTQTLHGQGTDRYTADEIRSFRHEIWTGINALLIEARKKATDKEMKRPFWVLGGEEPTEADATLFGFIVSVLVCTACPESQSLVRSFPVLLEYASRIHETYFPDYEKWE